MEEKKDIPIRSFLEQSDWVRTAVVMDWCELFAESDSA